MDKYHDCGHRPRNTDKRKRKREVESNTPETQKVFDWFYSRNADRVSSFIGINRVQARMEDLERERDMARKAPRHDPQWHPLTESKTQFICQRDGMTVSGFVVTSAATGECAIIDKSAVRWLSKDELWWLMHESDSPLNA